MKKWNDLSSLQELDGIVAKSFQKRQLIFKHSTRCGNSAIAFDKLESGTDSLSEHFDIHYLDLLKHRDISNEIATRFDILHESPQVIVVENGEPTVDLDHAMVVPEYILRNTGIID